MLSSPDTFTNGSSRRKVLCTLMFVAAGYGSRCSTRPGPSFHPTKNLNSPQKPRADAHYPHLRSPPCPAKAPAVMSVESDLILRHRPHVLLQSIAAWGPADRGQLQGQALTEGCQQGQQGQRLNQARAPSCKMYFDALGIDLQLALQLPGQPESAFSSSVSPSPVRGIAWNPAPPPPPLGLTP